MITTLLAYALLGLFLGSEGRVRGGGRARSLERTAPDRGSTSIVGAATGVVFASVVAAPVLNQLHIGTIQKRSAGWAGIAMMVSGLALRTWANLALAGSYTRTLQTAPDQRIVETGPYRWVRHPGYAGSILIDVGAGLATVNRYCLAAAGLAAVAAYAYRIRVEESMMLESLGDRYRGYMSCTKRLLPFVF
jgi:protein-S-isoprenylcysteine O-methyltransferase Ste14